MSFYRFKEKEILVSTTQVHPLCEFTIYNGSVYHNRRHTVSGAFVASTPNASTGEVNLYELNVDRTVSDTGIIYPFITKDSSLSAFKTVSATSFHTTFGYGDQITGSYPLTASITREYFDVDNVGPARPHIEALKTSFNHYMRLSQHFEYSSSYGDKSSQELSLISIPSIFYGSSIEKGTMNLKYYITGTLVAELNDYKKNGELVQIGPENSNGSGSIAGLVMYSEGFVILTGSWAVENDASITRDYIDSSTDLKKSAWIYFGTAAAEDGIQAIGSGSPFVSASYSMEFKGTNYIPNMTMLAHAPENELNFSNNPTFKTYNQTAATTPATSSIRYLQDSEIKLINSVSSSYLGYEEEQYDRQTFITKIGIYDEDKNLIAVANLATPVKKTEDQGYTFKLKLDI